MDDLQQKQLLNKGIVINRTWIFFEEGQQKRPKFEIQAKDYKDAYNLALIRYGLQVKNLYYCIK